VGLRAGTTAMTKTTAARPQAIVQRGTRRYPAPVCWPLPGPLCAGPLVHCPRLRRELCDDCNYLWSMPSRRRGGRVGFIHAILNPF